MPRHDGNSKSRERRKHAGHRMHKRGRAARRERAKYPKRSPEYATSQSSARGASAAEA
jgi:hypothetical protein